jgi:hypothetical protein
MTEFVVKIDERMTHSMVIEAASKEEAVAAAYKLLTDGMTPEIEKDLDYQLESDGYTGQHDAWEY